MGLLEITYFVIELLVLASTSFAITFFVVIAIVIHFRAPGTSEDWGLGCDGDHDQEERSSPATTLK